MFINTTVLLTFLSVVGISTPMKTEAIVTRVIDGDTIEVQYQNYSREIKELKVRLACIDAVESKQPFGAEATKFLKQRILQKNILLRIYDIDLYGRSIGKVYLNGDFINLEMIQKGYAWVYESYLEPCKRETKELRNAQTEAKKNKWGLWRGVKPIAPWLWRKKH